ncbi:hypothetical protein [Kaistia sp. MMO-174]|uniref:hypothetical protein n=1 Tax=Kaistia sp. MMO-174 TaxID=3081256 RepID=UPI0030162596
MSCHTVMNKRREIDRAMLDSLATWFEARANGYQGPHSFNDWDVAFMLARAERTLNLDPLMADMIRHHLRVAELLEANNRYLERARAAEAESARLKKILDACQWHWPEDDTSEEHCCSSPFEVLESQDLPAGTVAAIARGGIVEIRYCAQLPPDPDGSSDDDFEVDEATKEDAERKIVDELSRRAGQPQCLACAKQLHLGDRYFPDVSGVLCAECAPTYESLIGEPEGHVYMDDEEPRTAEDCRAQFDAHIAAGGKPTDSMATEVLA